MKLKVYIEERPHQGIALLHVYDDRNTYHLIDGVTTAVERGELPTVTKPFFEGPYTFVYALASAITDHLEAKGGVNPSQVAKGKIEAQTGEIQWLRQMIEKQLK